MISSETWHGRQQLLWQKCMTVIVSIDLALGLMNVCLVYPSLTCQLTQSLTDWTLFMCFVLASFFFVVAGTFSRLFCEFYDVVAVNNFLLVSQLMLISLAEYFKVLFWKAKWCISVCCQFLSMTSFQTLQIKNTANEHYEMWFIEHWLCGWFSRFCTGSSTLVITLSSVCDQLWIWIFHRVV